MDTTTARKGLVSAAYGLVMAILALVLGVVLFCVAVTSIALIPAGVGVVTTPPVLTYVRRYAQSRRRLTAMWFGENIPSPYRAMPPDVRAGITGQVERCVLLLKDQATWRDIRWLLVDATAGAAVALVPAGLIGQGVFGGVLAAGAWRPISANGGDAIWFTFIPVGSQATATLAAGLGVVVVGMGLTYAPALLRVHTRLTKAMLSPITEMELAQRVERPTHTTTPSPESTWAYGSSRTR